MVNRRVASVTFAGLALAGTLLLSGCAEVGQSPLAPGSTQTPVRAAKPTSPTVSSSSTSLTTPSSTLYVQSATGTFYPLQGGQLKVSFKQYGASTDVTVKAATFVDWGGLAAKTTITMTVYSGYTLEDVDVVFDPDGTTFNPPGTLYLTLLGPVDTGALAYHFHQGTITQVTTTIVKGQKQTLITFEIPGFSRYSLGGNDYAPEADTGW